MRLELTLRSLVNAVMGLVYLQFQPCQEPRSPFFITPGLVLLLRNIPCLFKMINHPVDGHLWKLCALDDVGGSVPCNYQICHHGHLGLLQRHFQSFFFNFFFLIKKKHSGNPLPSLNKLTQLELA
jgi:hypothetical protein